MCVWWFGGDILSESLNSDLIRGNIDTIILCVLLARDHYGYEIIKAIRQRSGGAYELKEPTLYASLRRLEKQKMIESYWGDETQGGRRKYYRLTDEGISLYKRNLASWEAARDLINQLITYQGEGTE
ncbi:PadR family transcriptional regulator [Alicyclobacillus shizuokensis]|uniref:PadR family transcriptional regulator n=1 Tax=Alicyclobacillus shizuokensis TaxID=392014 RepID=UPI00082B1A98